MQKTFFIVFEGLSFDEEFKKSGHKLYIEILNQKTDIRAVGSFLMVGGGWQGGGGAE